jgi:hypothetical protein
LAPGGVREAARNVMKSTNTISMYAPTSSGPASRWNTCAGSRWHSQNAASPTTAEPTWPRITLNALPVVA